MAYDTLIPDDSPIPVAKPLPGVTVPSSGSMASDQLVELETYYHESNQATGEVLAGLLDATDAAIDDATADSVRVAAEVAGSAYLTIDPHLSLVGSLTDRVINDTSRTLDRLADEVQSSGVNYPYDVGVQSQMLDADPIDWLPAVLPAIQTSSQTVPAAAGPDGTYGPGCAAQGYFPPMCAPDQPGPDGLCHLHDEATGTDCTVPCCPDGGTVPPGDCRTGCQYYVPQFVTVVAEAGGGQSYTTDRGPNQQCGQGLDPSNPSAFVCVVDGSCQPATCPGSPPTAPPTTPPTAPPPPQIPPTVPPGVCCPAPTIIVQCPPQKPTSPGPPPTSPPTVPPGSPPTAPPPPPPPPPGGMPDIPPVSVQFNPYGVDWGVPINSCDLLCSVPPPLSGESLPPDPAAGASTAVGRILSRLWYDVTHPFDPMTVLGAHAQQTERDRFAETGTDARTATTFLGNILTVMNREAVPNPDAAGRYATTLMMSNMAEKLTGFPATYLTQSIQYAFNACNPQLIPEQAGIDSLWATGRISDDSWKCLTLAHGSHTYWAAGIADLKVQRADLSQLVQLLLRGHITLDVLYARALKIGFRDRAEVDDALRLAIQLPGQPDLLRFMVRDVADEAVVAKYQYDSEFKDKFRGQLQAWAKAQGIPEEIFLYYWRSHWEIPPMTQLEDIMARCRPDRASLPEEQEAYTLALQQWIAEGSVGNPPAAPPVVTPSDVEDAIRVNDRAPGWIPASMFIMSRPITNSDAIRAYILGAFDETKLYEVFRDNKYSDRDARTLVEYWRSQAVQRVANQSGVLTQRAIAKLFREGSIDRQDADRLLIPLMPNRQQRVEMLDRLELSIIAEKRSTVIKGVRSQYHTAALDYDQSVAKMISYGVDEGQARRVAQIWEAERDTKGKAATTGQLCKWHARGLIDQTEFYRRLRILGYSDADANRIIVVCEEDEIIRRQKAALAAARATQSQWDRAIKILVALDPSLESLLNPLIGKPPKKDQEGSGGGPKK